jgi:hypothetical protein
MENMKDIFRTDKCQDLENFLGKMETFIKGNLRTIKCMEEEQ